MFEFFIKLSQIIMPIFVISTMLNVGLTQRLKSLMGYYHKDWEFFTRMLFTNFFIAPAIMILLVLIGRNMFDVNMLDAVGLTILSLTAGAPFLIKLTEFSENDIALGASLLLTLVLGTTIITPIMFPLILPSLAMNISVLVWSLVKSLILPVIVGMLVAKLLPAVARKLQPWVGLVGQYSMYLVLVAIFVGYFPQMKALLGSGSVSLGVVFILTMVLTGYFMGGKRDDADLKAIGGLGSAQRNIAASMIIAAENFAQEPRVLVLISMVSTIGIVILIVISKRLFALRDKDTDYSRIPAKYE